MRRRLLATSGPEPPEEAAEPLPVDRRLVPPVPLLAVVGAMPEARGAEQALAFLAAARDAGASPVALVTRRPRGAAGSAPSHEARVRERSVDDPREMRPLVDAGATRVIVVEAEPAEVAAALAEALPRLAGAKLAVSLGADVPAFVRPSFAVAIDRGASLVGWSPAARAIRDRFDARLPEPRDGWARSVVDALLEDT